MMNQRPGAEEQEVDQTTTLTLPPPEDVEFVMIMLVVSPAFYDR